MIQKGMFVSHRGQSLCCVNKDKFKALSPKDFWYSDIRKNALDDMNNDRPVKGCDQCYYNESNHLSSSRTFYNSYKNVATKDLPTMLDLDFSNLCNLKCVMCNSERSSQFAKDEGKGVSSVPEQYIQDLIEISDEVTHITIQGGEPTIMQEFTHYFQELHKKGITKNIDLQIITNLTNLNKEFTILLNNFKSVRLSVSLDAFGKANDYIRWPSKFHVIEKNIKKALDVDTVNKLEILNSLNIMSMYNYGDFLDWAKGIEDLSVENGKKFVLSPMKVFSPTMYSPFIAPLSLKEKYINSVKKFYNTNNFHKDSKTKIEMMLLCRKLERSQPNQAHLNDLVDMITELDKERSTNIVDFIPDFHDHIKKA